MNVCLFSFQILFLCCLRGRALVCMCACVRACVHERGCQGSCACARVCMYERERERERAFVVVVFLFGWIGVINRNTPGSFSESSDLQMWYQLQHNLNSSQSSTIQHPFSLPVCGPGGQRKEQCVPCSSQAWAETPAPPCRATSWRTARSFPALRHPRRAHGDRESWRPQSQASWPHLAVPWCNRQAGEPWSSRLAAGTRALLVPGTDGQVCFKSHAPVYRVKDMRPVSGRKFTTTCISAVWARHTLLSFRSNYLFTGFRATGPRFHSFWNCNKT